MTRRTVQQGAQRNVGGRVAAGAPDWPRDQRAPTPFPATDADAPKQPPCRKCGKADNPPDARRCHGPKCGAVLAGNQVARKYPKVDPSDPVIQARLKDDAERTITDRGGREVLSAVMLRLIPRLAFLGLAAESW